MPANPHDGSGREIFIRGERWVRDGNMWVPQSILDQVNGGEVDTNDPEIIAQIAPYKISFNEGLTTQTTEQRAQAQGDPTGQDQYYGMKRDLGQAEFDRRWQLANSIGVNRSTDTGPKGALADELFYGHIDELPGVPGVFFNARSNGTFVFKDSNGNEIPPNGQLMQAAQAGVQQGYGTGQARLNPDGTPRVPGGAGGPQTPPVLPPAPGAAGGPTKPKGPIFSGGNPGTQVKPEQPQLPPAPSAPGTDVRSLQTGVAQLPGASMVPKGNDVPGASMDPGSQNRMINMAPIKAAPQPAPIKMPDFSKIAGAPMGSGGGLPKAPTIGKAASSFKIG